MTGAPTPAMHVSYGMNYFGCLKPKAEPAIVYKNAARKDLLMELHMKEFDGTTFGMSVQASSPAFRRMKKNAYRCKITPHGSCVERTVWCVKATDVAAAMGEAGWLACKRNSMHGNHSMGERDGALHYL